MKLDTLFENLLPNTAINSGFAKRYVSEANTTNKDKDLHHG
ncbi:hypothetical protein ALT1644_150082 [Alteromonas macleodii]